MSARSFWSIIHLGWTYHILAVIARARRGDLVCSCSKKTADPTLLPRKDRDIWREGASTVCNRRCIASMSLPAETPRTRGLGVVSSSDRSCSVVSINQFPRKSSTKRHLPKRKRKNGEPFLRRHIKVLSSYRPKNPRQTVAVLVRKHSRDPRDRTC